jgi:NAD(P)-dependent dehydrogenase (short-subunit alcohol dehydrogenase family)
MEAAIITGGTRGIGAAIAASLADRKVRLVLNGRHRDTEAEQRISELAKHTDVRFIEGDASDQETATKITKLATDQLGRIDYVVPAAGGPNPGR